MSEAGRLPGRETDELTVQREGEQFILAAAGGGGGVRLRVSSDAQVISFGRHASAPKREG